MDLSVFVMWVLCKIGGDGREGGVKKGGLLKTYRMKVMIYIIPTETEHPGDRK